MKGIKITGSYLLCLLFCNLRTSNTQYMPTPRNTSKASACEGPNKTALVEHFFNVIFTEFHSSPPVCVCVQMCSGQPTYCYPNGCLKKVDNKKKPPDDRPAPVTVQNADAVNKMFLIDDKNDFTHVLNENEGAKAVTTKRPSLMDMRPDPFKDRYKILFKYKKMPKVEFRYNLREQVKNMKSDVRKVETKDVSKTRWPNANHMVTREQQVYKAAEKKNDRKTSETSAGNTKYIASNSDSFTSRYFKRDLRRNLKDDIDADMEFSTEIPDLLDSKNFSIETLIENLIGNNYEGKRDVDAESDVIINDSKDNQSREVKSLNGTELSPNITKLNEQTCVVSMNMTNQNLDKNKYVEDSPLVKERMNKWQNYTFNQMIAALAKKIEKQNNTSMEILTQSSSGNVEVASENKTNHLEIEDNSNTADETVLRKSFTDEIQTVIITNKSENNNTIHKNYRRKTETN